MGTLSLVCPMCCGESFDDSQSLKYHLLSMTDNLYCPNCTQRYDSVAALIQHLDCCGCSDEKVGDDQHEDGDSTTEKEIHSDKRDNETSHDFLADEDNDGPVIVGDPISMEMVELEKTEIEEDAGSVENSREFEREKSEEITPDVIDDRVAESRTSVKDEKSPAATLDEEMEQTVEPEEDETEEAAGSSPMIGIVRLNDQAQQIEDDVLFRVKQEVSEEESEALYSCSSCGMSFNSVIEHIKEYHDGQEVVLEMAEQQTDEMVCEDESSYSSAGGGSAAAAAGSDEMLASEKLSLDRGMDLGVASSSPLIPRHRQTMNTLRTEECVDSEGRLYTRKVVQIERFWDRGSVAVSQLQLQQHQQASKSGPMIEKFFSNVEGLRVRAKSPSNRASLASSPQQQLLQHRVYRCNKCLEQFSKLGDFRVHVCPDGGHQCEICERTFASAKSLQLHSRVHDPETESGETAGGGGDPGNNKSFVCPTCTTQFSSHKSLRLHSRMHAPVRARHVDAPEGTAHTNFTCLECGKTLSESYRKAHMALHTGDSATCTVCNRKFDSSDSLAMHAAVHIEQAQSQQQQQQQHQQQQQQQQQQQSSLSQQQQQESTRLSTQQPQEDANQATPCAADNVTESVKDSQKPYKCQHCGRRFTRPHEKVKHERIHTGEKPHACEVCGKTFRVSYCLTLHMRTHTGVRPYACQHCGKRFKASSVYNHHLLTHGEERAYTCPYCPKTFKTRVQLAGHKNSHTKPFRCTECSRPFASLYAARAHIQTHKKDNNFKFSCYICGASYGRAFALKDHLKVHAVQDALAAPEPAREEEVAEAEDYLITEDGDELEELEEIEDEERQLVSAAVTASSPASSVVLHQPSQ